MKLNLTNADRLAIRVDFSVNKFVVTTQGDVLLGSYPSKAAMRAELAENGIKPADVRFSSLAARQYLANYGNT